MKAYVKPMVEIESLYSDVAVAAAEIEAVISYNEQKSIWGDLFSNVD